MELLARLLRPPSCLGCGLIGVWPCCAACLPAAPGPPRPRPLAADPDVGLWCLGPYRTALRSVVLAGKLRGQRAALAVLGDRLGAGLAAAGAGADLVTWVASRPDRLGQRDHARVLAIAVAAQLGRPAVGLLGPAPGPDLGRARASAQASAQASTRARGPLPHVDRPPPPVTRRLTGGRVLVVDDVATTGATLAAAATALRHAGAAGVEAAVLAAAGAATLAATEIPEAIPAAIPPAIPPAIPESGIDAGFDPARSV